MNPSQMNPSPGSHRYAPPYPPTIASKEATPDAHRYGYPYTPEAPPPAPASPYPPPPPGAQGFAAPYPPTAPPAAPGSPYPPYPPQTYPPESYYASETVKPSAKNTEAAPDFYLSNSPPMVYPHQQHYAQAPMPQAFHYYQYPPNYAQGYPSYGGPTHSPAHYTQGAQSWSPPAGYPTPSKQPYNHMAGYPTHDTHVPKPERSNSFIPKKLTKAVKKYGGELLQEVAGQVIAGAILGTGSSSTFGGSKYS